MVVSRLFKLIINDLTFTTRYVKYVDDTTVLPVSKMLMMTHFKLMQTTLLIGHKETE